MKMTSTQVTLKTTGDNTLPSLIYRMFITLDLVQRTELRHQVRAKKEQRLDGDLGSSPDSATK